MRLTPTLVASLVAGVLVFGTTTPASADTVKPVPSGFHWGVSTSGYQSEGHASASNWSRYDDAKDPYGNSVDFRHRYKQDIARAASLGVDTFRFGIEWARVEPQPGTFNKNALKYYDSVVTEIRKRGMKPMITLSHWVHPAWFADQGAWSNGQSVDQFARYANKVVKRYAGRGTSWITFNEPFIYLQHEITEGQDPVAAAALPSKLVQAHNRAYDIIHRYDRRAKVSSNVAYIPGVEPVLDLVFVDQMKLDFLGVDYYYSGSLDNPTAYNAFLGNFWEVKAAPEGLYYALTSYHQRYPDLPIWIVENGMATDNGKPRPDGYTRSQHLRDHLYWMQRAMAEGVPVIGYNYWSITDNYEWGSYRPRFGLWTVDVLTDPTLTRRPTDAVATYTKLIKKRGVPAGYQLVRQPGVCNLDNLLGSCTAPLLGTSAP